MTKRITTIVLSLLIGFQAFAQSTTARVQVIHNAAASAAANVDVWISFDSNSVKLLEDFAFRAATPYIDAPAGTDLTISVTGPNSVDTANAVFHKTFNLVANDTYVVVAAGDPGSNFDLLAFAGRENPITSGNTSANILHGATDAPAVDLVEVAVPAGTLVSGLAFGNATDYIDLAAIDYSIQLQVGGVAAAEFAVPFSLFADSVVFVAASGYLDPAAQGSTNSFGLLAVTPAGTTVFLEPAASTTPARLQVIHNCATPAADSVDVYVNGALLLNNFAFRAATPYIDVPGATNLVVDIVEKSAADNSSPIYTQTFLLESNGTYVVVASGDVGTNFELLAFAGRENPITAGNTSANILHGSTDAPAVDLVEVAVPAGTLVSGLAFGNATDYIDLAAIDYSIQLQVGGVAAAEFAVPFSLFADSVVFVAASGYLDPAAQGSTNSFGLLAVTPAGTTVFLEPTGLTTPARLQIIHNSAVPAADSVDIYVNGMHYLDNFAFRTATGFLDIPGATEITIDVVEKSAADNSAPLYTQTFVLESNKTYQAIASGVFSLGSETYDPAINFEIIARDEIREVADNASEVDVLVFHGATDAPAVTVDEVVNNLSGIVSDLAYGEYAGYLSLAPAAYELRLNVAASGDEIATYQADLSSLAGAAITVVASGFVNPAVNNNGPAFGLFVATANGGNLIELSLVDPVSIDETSELENTLSIYPNPTKDWIAISGVSSNAVVNIYNLTGQVLIQQFVGLNNRIDLTELPKGMYLVEVQQDTERITKLVNKL